MGEKEIGTLCGWSEVAVSEGAVVSVLQANGPSSQGLSGDSSLTEVKVCLCCSL